MGAGLDEEPLTRAERWRRLGHPALFGCVAMLVLNDHVLKARYPGWWTGKLSDVAGLAAVGIVLAAAVGVRRGLTLAGGAFVLLKTAPGVAEAAAPFLGGITRRDPTDLIALAALPAVWVLFRRPERPKADRVSGLWSGRAQQFRTRVTAAVMAAAPIVGLVFATAATTATSCGPRKAVVVVASAGDAIYARVGRLARTSNWKVSTDGGWTWHSSEASDAPTVPTLDPDVYVDPGPTGAQEACTREGTCWRLQDRRTIQRIDPDGTVVDEFQMTDEAFSQISTGCAGGSVGVLASIAATDTDGTPHAVASFGADGALVRQSDGQWTQVRVGGAPPIEPNRIESAAPTAMLVFGPILGIAIWLIGRHRWPSWLTGVAVASAGWIATVTAAVVITFLVDSTMEFSRAVARVALPGMLITTVAAVFAARRPPRPYHLAHLPPPPPPGPPPPRRTSE